MRSAVKFSPRLPSQITPLRPVLRFKKLHEHVQQTQRSDHYNLFALPAKFRFVEISPMRIFALAKLFSLRRNFAGANFVAKFRRIFARTKNEKHRISFAFLLHSTLVCTMRDDVRV